MNKTEYIIKIAEILKEARQEEATDEYTLNAVATDLCDYFWPEDENFNRELFLNACGVLK